jgi:mono/diheme cytochrome c family protein
MDTGMLHSHTLVVSLYLLQLLVRVVLMLTANKELVAKYTKAMRIPHIVLSILMLATGVYLMVKAPAGVQPYILVKLGLVVASIPLGVIGSKRGSVALTALSFLLLAGVMGLAYTKPDFLRSASTPEIDPVKAGEDAATLKQGQALYEKYCVLCHGADGAAGFQGAKNLNASTMPDVEIVNIIQNGKGVMPPNTDLTDAEAQQVKDYVKYLRK